MPSSAHLREIKIKSFGKSKKIFFFCRALNLKHLILQSIFTRLGGKTTVKRAATSTVSFDDDDIDDEDTAGEPLEYAGVLKSLSSPEKKAKLSVPQKIKKTVKKAQGRWVFQSLGFPVLFLQISFNKIKKRNNIIYTLKVFHYRSNLDFVTAYNLTNFFVKKKQNYEKIYRMHSWLKDLMILINCC